MSIEGILGTTAKPLGDHPSADSPERTRDRSWWRTAAADIDLLAVIAVAVLLALRAYRAWDRGWYPFGDHAFVVIRSTDVFGRHTPLIGPPSSFANLATAGNPPTPHHPGPMIFWPMAPFVAALGPTVPALLASTWTLAVASLALVGQIARQLGGRIALVLSTAFALLILPTDILGVLDSLNPAMAALPFVATIFLTWAVVHGQDTRWPLLLLTASFVVQCDLAYLPSVCLFGLVAATATLRRVLHNGRASTHGACAPVVTTRTLRLSAAVVALCWGPPVLEAVLNRGGNLREMLRAASVGVPMRGLGDVPGLLGDLAAPLDLGSAAAFALLAVGTGMAVLLGRRARLPMPPGTAALGITAVAAATAGILSGVVRPPGYEIAYYRLPQDISFGFVWFAAAVAAISWITRRHWNLVTVGSWTVLAAGVWLVFVGTSHPAFSANVLRLRANLEDSLARPDLTIQQHRKFYGAAPPLARELEAVEPGASYALHAFGSDGQAVLYGLLLASEGRDLNLIVDPGTAELVGPQRADGWRENANRLGITAGSLEPPVRGARLVVRWDRDDTDDPVLERAQAEIAAAIRAQPNLAVGPSQVDLIAGALASSPDYHRQARIGDPRDFDDDAQRLVEDPARLAVLPDGVLVQLAANHALDSFRDLETTTTDALPRQSSVISLWILPPGSVNR